MTQRQSTDAAQQTAASELARRESKEQAWRARGDKAFRPLFPNALAQLAHNNAHLRAHGRVGGRQRLQILRDARTPKVSREARARHRVQRADHAGFERERVLKCLKTNTRACAVLC
eukprot:933952-Pleurochrysis_carterae.AAC.1